MSKFVGRTRSVVLGAAIVGAALAGCSRESGYPDWYDQNRSLYTVSSQSVRVSDVELTFESCSLPQQCDLLLQIANESNRCIAFNEVSLPDRDHVWLDGTFTLQRRIMGTPIDRVRQTFVVLQPGDSFRQAVDLHAIYNVSNLSGSSITFTTDFVECAALTGGSSQFFELVSAPITFERAP
jgi:hypothetical protein